MQTTDQAARLRAYVANGVNSLGENVLRDGDSVQVPVTFIDAARRAPSLSNYQSEQPKEIDMSSEYRTVFLDGVSVPTTAAGAAAIEALQGKLRQALADCDGLQGQLDAIKSLRAPASNGAVVALEDAQKAARTAHRSMAASLSDGWKGPAHGR